MAESRVNTGPGYANDVYSLDDLYGLADTEFVVDLIGSGDDMASNLAQRGLREIQLRSSEGGLSSLIRNLGGDATVEELPLYIAGVPSAGVYNPNTFPVPVREGSSKTAYEGSRGPVNIPSRGIIVGQDAEKGVIRHELEHAGIKSITDPLDVGMSPVESAPLSILSEVIRERSIKDRSPYTSNPEHFLIESMQASEHIRSGENLPEEYKEERESFYPIGRYLNNPTPENRDIVLRVLDDILTMPAKDYNKAPYGEQVILGARQDMLHFLRMDQRKRGVPEEYLFTAEEITPEMLLESLEKSIENFNAPVERGYSTKTFAYGGEVREGIGALPVVRDPRPTDQRNEAFGAKLLKLAGLATTPREIANRVDPKLYEQLDVVLGRRPGERSFKSSSSSGIEGYFPRKVVFDG